MYNQIILSLLINLQDLADRIPKLSFWESQTTCSEDSAGPQTRAQETAEAACVPRQIRQDVPGHTEGDIMAQQFNTITRDDIKKNNRVRIFKALQTSGRMSSQELSRKLDLSIPTVNKNLVSMEEDQLLLSPGQRGNTGGRSSKIYEVNSKQRYAIAVAITRHHISGVAVDLSGRLTCQVRYSQVYCRQDSYFRKLGRVVDELLVTGNINRDKVLGVAIVLPALITKDGRQTYYNGVLNDDPVMECEEFSKYISFPTAFFHDTEAAAYAERSVDEDTSDFFYMMISDSLGGGVMLHNQPYVGKHNRSGEVGHIKIMENGKKCYCGGNGCLEAYCSTRVLSAICDGDLADYFQLLEEKDERALQLWEEYLNHLAHGINTIRLLFDCKVVVGGYLGQFAEKYLSQLQDKVKELDPFSDDVSYLSFCKYKNEAAATGAALMYIDEFISSI